MTETGIDTELATAEECRPLYERMARVKALAPWEFMEEGDLFAVIDPETGEPGFVSVMGMAGEHFAVAVYKGVEGLYAFSRVQELGPAVTPDDILDMPNVQASFEDREMVEKRDREHMKALGLKFRGRNAWPLFRSYQPGFAPWFIDRDEARLLAYALEQLLDVGPRLLDAEEDLLMPGGDDDFLVRVPEQTDGGLVWRDETRPFAPPPARDMMIHVELEMMAQVAALPVAPITAEVDCFRILSVIAPPGERPYFSYAVLAVEPKQGAPVGLEMLQPFPTLDDMWADTGSAVLGVLLNAGFRPRQLHVRNSLLHGILSMIGSKTGIKVKRVTSFEALDDVAEGLSIFMGGMGLF